MTLEGNRQEGILVSLSFRQHFDGEPNRSPSVEAQTNLKGAMMDPFVSALEELAEALLAGEDPESALQDIAQEHDLATPALRNRALRAFGPLETYRERQAELKKEREQTARRR